MGTGSKITSKMTTGQCKNWRYTQLVLRNYETMYETKVNLPTNGMLP